MISFFFIKKFNLLDIFIDLITFSLTILDEFTRVIYRDQKHIGIVLAKKGIQNRDYRPDRLLNFIIRLIFPIFIRSK